LAAIEQKAIVHDKNGKPTLLRRPVYRKYPKAVRHFMSLFPNNYLDIVDLKQERKPHKILFEFRSLLNTPNVSERALINFIRNKGAFFIIASILKDNYHFGHHDAYIFPEFPLGNTYKADYLLVGKSSGGYEFVFVELESAQGCVTTKDGELGSVFRKGYNQIIAWNEWIEANFHFLSESFSKLKKSTERLDEEFLKFDKSRIHYCLVAGRRSDFSSKTYRIRRRFKQNNILLLHYENLMDCSNRIIGKDTY